jgi:hypothetical protein
MQWAIKLNAGIFGLSECIHSGAVLTQMSAFGAAAKHLLQISHTHDHIRAISFPTPIRQVISMPHVVMNKRKIDAALGKLQKVKRLLKAFKTKNDCKLSRRCNDTDYRPLQIHRRTRRPPSDPFVLGTGSSKGSQSSSLRL